MVKDLVEKALNKQFSIQGAMPALRALNSGALEDVLNINGVRYYQWLPGFIDTIRPKQIVELGGAMGVSALMMLQSKWQRYKLYSITLPEQGQEFMYVVDNYKNLIKVLGDDLDLNSWPEELDLSKTDLCFFDSLHTEEQLQREIDLYIPKFKKGTICLFDDIHLDEGMEKTWNELCQKYDNYDGTDPLHFSGFGIIQL